MLSCEENADTTLVYATRARDIARRIDYPKGVADATNNLGIFFDINGSSELALHYYSDACSSSPNCSKPTSMFAGRRCRKHR